MKTIEEIRRDNLLKLIEDSGVGITKFSEHLGRSQSQISNLKNSVREIGSELAREIERALNLERGWMDNDHTKNEPLYTTHDPLIARAMMIMEPMPVYAKELEIRSLAEKTELIKHANADAEQRDTNRNGTEK